MKDWVPLLLSGQLLVSLAPAAESTPAPEVKKPDPPRLLLALPLVIAAGQTNLIQLRGLNLTNITALRFSSGATDGFTVTNASGGKADALKDYDAKKFGDNRVEVTVVAPCDCEIDPGATNALVAIAPTGESNPWPLWILPAATLMDEREPNGGWRDAPVLGPARFIRGTIQEAADVDVFRWAVQPGERWRLQVHAASRGSALDSIITIYDADGNILTSNDDVAGGRDSAVEWNFQRGGLAAVAVQDAHDKGGPAHAYVLEITGPERGEGRTETREPSKRVGRK